LLGYRACLRASAYDRGGCKRDFWQLAPREALTYGWDGFVNTVKHHTQYVFAVETSRGTTTGDGEAMAPAELLNTIGEFADTFALVHELPKGSRFFRARVHCPNEEVVSAEALGTPPTDCARFANRMSPAGIPMFYGACERDTALAEVTDTPRRRSRVISVGAFETARDLQILDLSELPGVPSIFDSADRERRAGAMFLSSFVHDVAGPILRDGREHIEYVPTQVVTEYFRRIYRTPDGGRLGGMLYRSSRTEAGKCCVLFFEAADCCDIRPGWKTAPKSLAPDEPRWWLGLDEASVERV